MMDGITRYAGYVLTEDETVCEDLIFLPAASIGGLGSSYV